MAHEPIGMEVARNCLERLHQWLDHGVAVQIFADGSFIIARPMAPVSAMSITTCQGC